MEARDKGIKLITNAGGMNIDGCLSAIRDWAEAENLKGYKIGYVTGDDIKDMMPRINRPAPTLGQDNEEILRDLLGFDSEKIDSLKEKAVI